MLYMYKRVIVILCFLIKVLQFLLLVLVLQPTSNWYEVRVEGFFSSYGYPIVPATFVQISILSHIELSCSYK